MSNTKYRAASLSNARECCGYHCKYCDVWTNDDKISREHHENGGRHKGNVERWIRGLYQRDAEQKRAKAVVDREMAAINSAAEQSIARDLGVPSSARANVTGEQPGATKRPRRPAQDGLSHYGYGLGQASLIADQITQSRNSETVSDDTVESRIGQWEEVKTSNRGHMSRVSTNFSSDQLAEESDGPNQRLNTRTFPDAGTVSIAPLELKRKRRNGNVNDASDSKQDPQAERLAHQAIELKEPSDDHILPAAPDTPEIIKDEASDENTIRFGTQSGEILTQKSSFRKRKVPQNHATRTK